MHPPSALIKLHNVLGQCFLNILVLSCDLEPIGVEEGFENASERERERPGERCSLGLLPTQATHQYSEYSEAKHLDARVPVDTK